MTLIDREALIEALYDLIAADRTGSYDGGDHHAHVNRITRRYAAAVDAARAEGYEQGAARVREAEAEAERLRAAMERARDSCLHHATGKCFSIDDEHVCVEAEQDAFYDAAMWLTAALRSREDVLRDARIAEAAPHD